MNASAKTGATSLVGLIRIDLREMAAVKAVPYPRASSLFDVLTLPGTWAVMLQRVAHALHGARLTPLSRLLYFANVVLFGFDVPPTATFGPGLVVPHPVGVAIDGRCVFGARNRILRSVAVGGSADPGRPGAPTTGDDVWLMDGAKLFGKVHVGDRSILGAAAIVSEDVPADTFVFGPRSSSATRSLKEMGLEGHELRDSAWRLRAVPDTEAQLTSA